MLILKKRLEASFFYKIKKLLDHRTVDITEHYLNLSYLDYKENLEIFQNELFKGFSNLKDEDKDEQKQEVTTGSRD